MNAELDTHYSKDKHYDKWKKLVTKDDIAWFSLYMKYPK